jgi:hypothetical protein
MFSLSGFSALSLLLFVSLGCLWVRTLLWFDTVSCERPLRQVLSIETSVGGLKFWWSGNASQAPFGWKLSSTYFGPYLMEEYWDGERGCTWLGFRLYCDDNITWRPPLPLEGMRIPLWFPMALTLILPLCWLRRQRRA